MKTALVAVLLALIAGGCGSGDPAARPTKTVTVTESADPESEGSPEPESDPSLSSFDTTIEFDDGLAVVVSRPKRFTPSSEADLDGNPLPKRGVPVMFTLTLTNKGTRLIDPSMPLLTVTSGGESLQSVGLSDPKFGIDGLAKEVRLLPGKRAVSHMGYFVTDSADISIDIAIGEYATITFAS